MEIKKYKIQNDSCCDLSLKEIESLFKDGFLLEQESFYVIDKDTGEYDTLHYESCAEDEANGIRNAFLKGNTVIIKRLESYNDKLKEACNLFDYAEHVNLHCYIAPEGGRSFDWHVDDREVQVRVLYGDKIMLVKEEGQEKSFHLQPGDWLNIPKGVEHKAINVTPTIMFSFGIVRDSEKWRNCTDRHVTFEDLSKVYLAPRK